MSGVIPSKQLSFVGVSDAATTPLITNKTLALAGTEYAHTLQNNLKQLIISSRTRANVRIAFTLGGTATDYKTIWVGGATVIDNINFTGKTLYLRSDQASTIMEIVELYS